MPPNPRPSASASAFATLDRVAARTPDGAVLFDNLTLAFGAERTGVVGRNGVGKSTLLRLISGEQSPAEGVVSRAGAIGVLRQQRDPGGDETVRDALGVAEALAAERAQDARPLSAVQAARRARVRTDRVLAALAAGSLPGERQGRAWRVSPVDLKQWIDQGCGQ
jgi:ATPase subunit of ABC transporter with duplicated ATPase domains